MSARPPERQPMTATASIVDFPASAHPPDDAKECRRELSRERQARYRKRVRDGRIKLAIWTKREELYGKMEAGQITDEQADDPLKNIQESIGMKIPQLASRGFAAQSGRSSWRYIGLDAFGRFFRARRQQVINHLMKEALYNPDVARDMATMAPIPNYPYQAMRKMNVWLFALGFSPIGDEQSASARK